MNPPREHNPIVPDDGPPVRATPGRVPIANRVVSAIAGTFFAITFSGFMSWAIVDGRRALFPAAMVAGTGAAFLFCVALGLIRRRRD